MDSNGSSVNTNEHSKNGDHNPDLVMVGTVPVCLKWKEHKKNSSLSCTVNGCDHFKLGRVQKATSVDISNLDNEEEFSSSFRHGNKRKIRIDIMSKRGSENNGLRFRSNERSSSQLDSFRMSNNIGQRYESSLPNQFGKKRQSRDAGSKSSSVTRNLPPNQPFNICFGEARCQASWRDDDEEIMQYFAEAKTEVLRPGMVLLKHYITPDAQVYIVKTCQKLGLGPGGFYRPSYENGAKLRLQMMCLGLNWDVQTGRYEDKRAIDGAKPPDIPPQFADLVRKALKAAHASIKKETDTSNVEEILPSMSPDLCIVNFYTTSGKLGLHKDCDESKQSLSRGLPVVSFSVGNSADFLYGDQRNVDKAENVTLESGDILIFGGDSRHIYHGVSSIIPDSAPRFLLRRTGLRPGRLNLTFREY